MRAPLVPLALLGALLAGSSCSDGEPGAPAGTATASAAHPWFEEVAAQRGLEFTHTTGHGKRHLFPECIAGGGGLLDLDEDGDLDAYLVQSGYLEAGSPPTPSDRLYLNDGAGRFRDATEESGVLESAYGMGLAAGDSDEDGHVDLYVLNLGPNALLQNDGHARFRDVTAEAGVGDPSWSVSAAFFDMENDGDLDVYVANYIVWSLGSEIVCTRVINDLPDYCSPKQYQAPAPDVLYRNDGTGKFEDVSAQAGLRVAFGNSLGVVVVDFDADGSSDVFVANDGTPNHLWRNKGDGRFSDEAMALGFAFDQHGFAKAGMGIAAGDVDGDGDEDVLVVNQGGEADSLFRNESGRFLFDATLQVGLGAVTRPYTRFGVTLADFDSDGLLDLFEANGRVERAPEPLSADPYAERNMLLRGTPRGRFEEVLPRGGTAEPLIATGRAAALGDVDGDGGLDVLVVNRDGPAWLLRNALEERGHWLRLRVLEASGRDALGAIVTVRSAAGESRHVVRGAFSFACANDPAVHVGLGATARADELVVRWVDGSLESFGPSEADRTVELRHGQGKPAESR